MLPPARFRLDRAARGGWVADAAECTPNSDGSAARSGVGQDVRVTNEPAEADGPEESSDYGADGQPI